MKNRMQAAALAVLVLTAGACDDAFFDKLGGAIAIRLRFVERGASLTDCTSHFRIIAVVRAVRR